MIIPFLITFREGLEIALILGIVLAYIAQTKAKGLSKYVLAGFILAVAVSLTISVILNLVGIVFSGLFEQLYEGITSIFAALILTSVIIWMRKKGPTLKLELENKVDQALRKGTTSTLFGLSFIIVVREGIEIALFLQQSVLITPVLDIVLGAIIGFGLAFLIGFILFRTSVSVPTKAIFNFTNILLIFIAAGLVAYGIHELQEAEVIPIIIEHLYDINFILDENSPLGSILKTLLGYNGNPSLIEVISYLGFLTVSLVYFKISKPTLVKNKILKDAPENILLTNKK